MGRYLMFEWEVLRESWRSTKTFLVKHLAPEIVFALTTAVAGWVVNPYEPFQGIQGAILIAVIAVAMMFICIFVVNIFLTPYKLWRRDQEKVRRLTTKETVEPKKHDIDLIEAVHYIAFGIWEYNKLIIDENNEYVDMETQGRLIDASKKAKQAVIDGDLPIWGVKDGSEMYELVEESYSYWNLHWPSEDTFKYGEYQEKPIEEYVNRRRESGELDTLYHYFSTSKQVVEKLWPKAAINYVRVLYAEGVELRNNAASLRILDPVREKKMDELREKLTRIMEELAPAPSINLRTLNNFDPRDHPKMLLQDPQSTLIFSEFLLRVQGILKSIK